MLCQQAIVMVYAELTSNRTNQIIRAQQVQALIEAGHEVDLLSRGSLELPGVGCYTHRHTWANLISWTRRSVYNDAKKRAFASFGVHRRSSQGHTLRSKGETKGRRSQGHTLSIFDVTFHRRHYGGKK